MNAFQKLASMNKICQTIFYFKICINKKKIATAQQLYLKQQALNHKRRNKDFKKHIKDLWYFQGSSCTKIG